MEVIQVVDSLDAVQLPPVLYKYRTFSNPYHQRIILEGSVFFASPLSFDDKKDCHPNEIFPSRDIVESRIRERTLIEYPEISEKDRIQLVSRLADEAPILNIELRKQLSVQLFEDYCKCHGVLSVTENPYNESMWEEYGDKHKGFCVGFNSKKLAAISSGGGRVEYCDKLPDIFVWIDDLKTEITKRVFYKERIWEYEQEYRLLKTWPPLSSINSEVNRNVILPDNSIEIVICGKQMPLAHVEQMSALVREFQPQARVVVEN